MRIRLAIVYVAMLLAVGAPAQGADPVWIQVTSPNFVLFTDTNEEKGRRLVEDFERRLGVMDAALGGIPRRQFPIQVYLFSRREEFLEAAPRPTGPDAPREFEKDAYFWRGPDRVFVGARDKSPEDIADDVGHALGHVFFDRLVWWRPFWLAEGAAEYFRKAGRDPDTKRISEEDGYPVADLLEIVPSSEYDDDAPPSPFRIQSHRLLRVVLADHPESIRAWLRELGAEDGRGAVPEVPVEEIETRFAEYVETRIDFGNMPVEIQVRTLTPEAMALQRGDLLLAANRMSEAASWYNGSSAEALAARAILARFSRTGDERIIALERATRELPESGRAHYHLGSIETDIPAYLELQVRALHRAVELLPRFGRAHGELGRVYALTGNGEEALKHVARALELEPEFADRFVAIRAEAYLALAQYGDAVASARTAAALPHTDRSIDHNFRAAEMVRRIDRTRRDAEDRRLEQIRAEVAAVVAEREPPPPPPPPPPPQRFGRIEYNAQLTRQTTILNAPLPEYPAALVQKGSAGTVTVQVTVGPDGRVTRAAIAASEVPEMNGPTLAALRKWTFAPARGARGPAAFDGRIVLRFIIQ